MNKNKLKYAGFLASIIIVLAFFSSNSCQQDSLNNGSKFLSFSATKQSLDKLSKEELNNFILALERIQIVSENGFYEIVQKNGQEINISENLFSYIKQIVENSNRLVNAKSKNSTTPHLRSDTVEFGDNINCVAHTIHAISNDLGGYYTYSGINAFLNDSIEGYAEYGVPLELMGFAVGHFFNYEYQAGPPMYYNYLNAGNTRTMAVLDYWDGTGHAAVLLISDGELAYIWDEQTGKDVVIENWRIRRRYKILNVKY